ncbi:MAG: FAD binding domain-containing protein [Gammaproteobacteria bacterium]|uniref:FAD binding domain-containing protein n=1 Tax=Azohydromonas sp. TaxID=1872666 RepID=UPI002C09528F|nr:FAD binding domain-containing protein [Azohydromonas sp.]HMM85246.1 FAD binding domain-containing protein [Azohydromonas sp.]
MSAPAVSRAMALAAGAAQGGPLSGVQRYLAPTGLAAALGALAHPGGATVLAGGTDLMPQSHARRVPPRPTLLNIRRVEGLDRVAVDGDALLLGTLVTITTLLEHPLVRAHAPLLAVAADRFASAQVRNAATLGGNLCNASPASDTATPLLALDAEVELAALDDDGEVRTRRMRLDAFFDGPGRTRRAPHELLTAVRVPLAPAGQVVRFEKAGTRPALDISTISLALAARRDGRGALHGVRLALGAVAPVPLRARAAESLLEGRVPDAALAAAAAQAAADAASPIDDVRASGWYRRELVRNLTQRMIDDVARR